MVESGNSGKEWDRIAGTTQSLVRSRLEATRILGSILRSRAPLVAYMERAEHLFVSRLRHVDPDCRFIVLDYTNDKAANAAVLAAPQVVFTGNNDGAHIEFAATDAAETVIDDVLAIRFAFPEVLVVQQRRAHRRIRVVPEVPLHCIADTRGIMPFDAKIIDISLGGLGALIYDSGINLEPGTVLRGCKIVHPRGTVVDVDIEIRYTVNITLPDGSAARRSGCAFTGVPGEIEDLIKVFILDLEKSGDDRSGGAR
jgi:c-di-GMP-binding flagellar brake protein YcgR